YDDAEAECLRVAQELAEARLARVGRDFEPVYEVARLLKLNREEEGRAHVVALERPASVVFAAGVYLARPEAQAVFVRLAVEKILILLTDEEARLVERVRVGGRGVVVRYQHGRDSG